jgi:predicted N-formylglutamate amidohydrolase
MPSETLVLSCEHASKRVPRAYSRVFQAPEARRALAAHWGWDIGAAKLARRFQHEFQCPVFFGKVTRLLVDLNRSPHHPGVHSVYCQALDSSAKQRLFECYYYPYRAEVCGAVQARLEAKARVVHVSVHTFTPRLGIHVRRADVGLLYDPGRSAEALLAARWKHQLEKLMPGLSVRRNYPYRGSNDGLTRALRGSFAANRYLGLELEVNQRFFEGKAVTLAPALTRALITSLAATLTQKAGYVR